MGSLDVEMTVDLYPTTAIPFHRLKKKMKMSALVLGPRYESREGGPTM